MNYLEEMVALKRRVHQYQLGLRSGMRGAGGPARDKSIEHWRADERRILKLREYFLRHGIPEPA